MAIRKRMGFLGCLLACCVLAAHAADVSGKWVAEISGPGLLEPVYARVSLERSGDALSGT